MEVAVAALIPRKHHFLLKSVVIRVASVFPAYTLREIVHQATKYAKSKLLIRNFMIQLDDLIF